MCGGFHQGSVCPMHPPHCIGGGPAPGPPASAALAAPQRKQAARDAKLCVLHAPHIQSPGFQLRGGGGAAAAARADAAATRPAGGGGGARAGRAVEAALVAARARGKVVAVALGALPVPRAPAVAAATAAATAWREEGKGWGV